MEYIEEQLSRQRTLNAIADELKIPLEHLIKHLQTCITQDSALGWEIPLNLLIHVQPLSIRDESPVEDTKMLYQPRGSNPKPVPFDQAIQKILTQNKNKHKISIDHKKKAHIIKE
jgi:hypothetical protein